MNRSEHTIQWLALNPGRLRLPEKTSLSIKKPLYAASLLLQHEQTNDLIRVTGEASAKIPLKGPLGYRASSEHENQKAASGFAFDRFLENDGITGRECVWTRLDNRVVLVRTDAKSSSKSECELAPRFEGAVHVLSPLQLPLAIADSFQTGQSEYGGFFVSGDRLRAIRLIARGSTAEPIVTLAVQTKKAENTIGEEAWSRLNWSFHFDFECRFNRETGQIVTVRFQVPVMGSIELTS